MTDPRQKDFDERPKEYVVSYKTSRQISPDDWELSTPSLKVTNATTIGQIMEWLKREEKISDVRFDNWDVRMTLCTLKNP